MTLTTNDIAMIRTIVKEETSKDFSCLKTSVSYLENDNSTLKTDVNTLKTDVAVLKTDVAVIKEDVSILKEDMSHVKKRLDKMDYNFDDTNDNIQFIMDNMLTKDDANTIVHNAVNLVMEKYMGEFQAVRDKLFFQDEHFVAFRKKLEEQRAQTDLNSLKILHNSKRITTLEQTK